MKGRSMTWGKINPTLRIIEILRIRSSPLLVHLKDCEDISLLERDLREKIVEELADELNAKGSGDDDEPNEYGLEIEDLIAACRLWRDEIE